MSKGKKTGLENVTGPEKSLECQMAPASKAQAGHENKALNEGERILLLRNKDDRREERNTDGFRRNSHSVMSSELWHWNKNNKTYHSLKKPMC